MVNVESGIARTTPAVVAAKPTPAATAPAQQTLIFGAGDQERHVGASETFEVEAFDQTPLSFRNGTRDVARPNGKGAEKGVCS